MDSSVADDLLLLGLDRETGRRRVSSVHLDCGLAGAVLAELRRAGRVDLVDGKVGVVRGGPVGDAEADAAIVRIAGEAKPRRPEWWIGKLRSGLRDRMLARLTERGVVRVEPRRVAWVIPVRRYVACGSPAESATLARLRSVVVSGAEPDPRTAALASLLDACGLARRTFPELGRSELTARMRELGEGEWPSAAVRKAIQSVEAGMIAASTVATSGGS